MWLALMLPVTGSSGTVFVANLFTGARMIPRLISWHFRLARIAIRPLILVCWFFTNAVASGPPMPAGIVAVPIAAVVGQPAGERRA
jgi:hypothetical protein